MRFRVDFRILIPIVLWILCFWLASILARAPIIGLTHAGEMQTTWTKPTKNCDGTDLTNLGGYRVYWGKATVTLPASALGYNITGLPPGDWWVSVSAFNTQNEFSQFVSAGKTIPATEFLTTAPTVYTVVKGTDKFLFLPVGTVALGVQCDATQPIGSYYVVPRASVTWSGNVKPVVVVATCG